jgi:pyrroline-5-carboxylate reductase
VQELRQRLPGVFDEVFAAMLERHDVMGAGALLNAGGGGQTFK